MLFDCTSLLSFGHKATDRTIALQGMGIFIREWLNFQALPIAESDDTEEDETTGGATGSGSSSSSAA